MKKIGLLSDTHSFLDPRLKEMFKECDEIWHGGDIGQIRILDELRTWNKNIRAVYGNIDDKIVRVDTIRDLWFKCEEKLVFITHIAGYPGRYNKRIKEIFLERTPDIFVCGHSHILKVMYDNKFDFLHLNPGACGHIGFHHMRTALRFVIDGSNIRDMELIELGPRGMNKV
jgi:putative phosphoesterase